MARRKPSTERIDQPRAATGITGLDGILGGGLPRNHIYLIDGEPGAGKTTLGLQFLLDGGRINLRCIPEKEIIRITVSDTGIGIPQDKLDAVFEPFVQVNRGYATPQEGTGLGLSISRDLARRMGGDLTATSGVGTGSQFTLTLPRAK